MTDTDRSLKEWEDVYEGYRPLYTAFVEKLEGVIRDLLYDADVSHELLWSWTYDSDDFYLFMTRQRRAGHDFENPLDDLTGWAGVGLTVSGRSASVEAIDVIRGAFVSEDLAWTASDPVDTAEYASARYSIALDETRASLPDWKAYEGLRAVLEVRTVMEDAWADLSGSLPYRYERTYPPEARELRIHLAELLKSADETFSELSAVLAEVEEAYADAIREDRLNIELDGKSLHAYLDYSETIANLVDIGVNAGLNAGDEHTPSWFQVEHGTLWLAERNGIRTLAELDDFLLSARDRAPAILADIAEATQDRNFQPWAFSDSIVEWLLLVLRRADAETVSLMRYVNPIEDGINAVIGNPVTRRSDS
jgi:putative GTP pyrophosphokinase